MEPKRRLEPEAEVLLRQAGWFPGRDVGNLVDAWARELSADGGFVIFDAAAKALAEFGGLEVRPEGRGQTMARQSLDLHPTLADGEQDRFAEFSQVISQRLYPLGEGSGGQYFIGIAEHGEVFAVGDHLIQMGSSIDDALSSLLLGRMGVRILSLGAAEELGGERSE